MNVTVIQNHAGEGQFPDFVKGTAVEITGEECAEFAHWFPCTISGYATYVPIRFVTDHRLNRDYNPTELIQSIGDKLIVLEIIHAWLFAKNTTGKTGWIPAEAVVSA